MIKPIDPTTIYPKFANVSLSLPRSAVTCSSITSLSSLSFFLIVSSLVCCQLRLTSTPVHCHLQVTLVFHRIFLSPSPLPHITLISHHLLLGPSSLIVHSHLSLQFVVTYIPLLFLVWRCKTFSSTTSLMV